MREVHPGDSLGASDVAFIDAQIATSNLRNGNPSVYIGMQDRVKSISFEGGYDRGRYFLNGVRAQKRLGGFGGRISLDASKKIDWDFHTEELMLSDLD